MRVEITDREKWKNKVSKAIEAIRAERKRRDDKYKAEWAEKYDRRSPLVRFLIGPTSRTAVATVDNCYAYPSCYAWGDEAKLKRILDALNSDDTGTIYIDGDELRAAR